MAKRRFFTIDVCPLLPGYQSERPERATQNTALIGAGCDNQDNNCDRNFLDEDGDSRLATMTVRVDECDEDMVPPIITLAKDPPRAFIRREEAVRWFNEHKILSDDCASAARLRKDLIEQTDSFVIFQVYDTRCDGKEEERATVNGEKNVIVDGPGASRSENIKFDFILDSCPFLPFTGENHPILII